MEGYRKKYKLWPLPWGDLLPSWEGKTKAQRERREQLEGQNTSAEPGSPPCALHTLVGACAQGRGPFACPRLSYFLLHSSANTFLGTLLHHFPPEFFYLLFLLFHGPFLLGLQKCSTKTAPKYNRFAQFTPWSRPPSWFVVYFFLFKCIQSLHHPVLTI